MLAVSTQTISVIGPSLGGLLIGIGGWRTTFALDIPVALFSFILGARRFPKQSRATQSGEPTEKQARTGPKLASDLDLLGMALFAGTLVAVLLFLMRPRPQDWYLLVITAAAAAAFTARERSAANPFIDLRILGSNTPLLITYCRMLLAYIVSYSFIYGYTQWLEDGRGLSAGHAGLLLLPLFATGIAVSITSGRQPEIRAKLVISGIAQIIGLALLLTLQSSAAVWLLVLVAFVFGIPQGLNSLALQNSVYRQSSRENIGASAGLLRTFGYLGAIISSAAQGLFYGHAADTSGLHHLTLLLICIACVFLLITVLDRSSSRSVTTL